MIWSGLTHLSAYRNGDWTWLGELAEHIVAHFDIKYLRSPGPGGKIYLMELHPENPNRAVSARLIDRDEGTEFPYEHLEDPWNLSVHLEYLEASALDE